ncbi:hypothetical protein Tco_0290642 [Tanacetum coccineum]
MAEYSQKWHNETSRARSTETSDGLAAIQAQLNNLGREIKKNSKLIFKSRQATILFPSHLNDYYYDEKKGSYGLQCLDAYSYGATRVDNSLPRMEKETQEVSLYPANLAHTKLTIELVDRTVKHPKGIAENVLVGIVVENMDGYRDQDMGDVIFEEPFCKASCVEARRFDGLITIHNGNDDVTYQMARSYPIFKHLSNAQCNKIRPLLKVSVPDKLNEISHPKMKD